MSWSWKRAPKSFDSLKELKKSDAKAFEAVWKCMREDGLFIEAGENDNLIVQKLSNNPNAFGIFGFANVAENAAMIRGLAVDGVAPTFETIASGEYKVARPLFVYAKKQHVGVIPGMTEFVAEFTSEKAVGEDGYLSEKGLITLPGEEGDKIRESARAMTVLTVGPGEVSLTPKGCPASTEPDGKGRPPRMYRPAPHSLFRSLPPADRRQEQEAGP